MEKRDLYFDRRGKCIVNVSNHSNAGLSFADQIRLDEETEIMVLAGIRLPEGFCAIGKSIHAIVGEFCAKS